MRVLGRALRTRRYITVVGAALAVAVGSAAAASPAVAAGYDGVLGIYGPGTVYAGTDRSGLEDGAYASVDAATTGSGVVHVEVLNKGSVTSQYRLNLEPDDFTTIALLAGSTDVTPLATGSYGYITGPIAPGKAQVLTVKMTAPAGALIGESFFSELDLWSPNQDQYLGSVWPTLTIKGTATGSHDIYATANSQAAVPGTFHDPLVTAATIKTNAIATYTVTLKNEAPAAVTIQMPFFMQADTPSCSSASFVVKAMVGTTDITALAESANGYLTHPLTKGQSVVVKVTVQSVLPHPDESFCANYATTLVATGPGETANGIVLQTNALS